MKNKKTTHNIVLFVDTVGLFTNCNTPNLDLNDYCEFAGQQSQNIELFTTDVEKNDSVFWIGLSTTNTSHSVEITDINHRFGKTLLQGATTASPASKALGKGRSGKIKTGKKNDFEKYDLSFDITDPSSGKCCSFKIDPIINIHR
jgi:hypothetical protein